jgi:hypothetical protein
MRCQEEEVQFACDLQFFQNEYIRKLCLFCQPGQNNPAQDGKLKLSFGGG